VFREFRDVRQRQPKRQPVGVREPLPKKLLLRLLRLTLREDERPVGFFANFLETRLRNEQRRFTEEKRATPAVAELPDGLERAELRIAVQRENGVRHLGARQSRAEVADENRRQSIFRLKLPVPLTLACALLPELNHRLRNVDSPILRLPRRDIGI